MIKVLQERLFAIELESEGSMRGWGASMIRGLIEVCMDGVRSQEMLLAWLHG